VGLALSHVHGSAWMEGVLEEDAEENIWILKAGDNV
jgi:hypothetical protein